MFEPVSSGQTGIDFENTICPSDEFNVLTYNYLYNGAGVGVGDFDRDGLPDLYFAGNQVSSRLYLNRGEFRFEDKTVSAGVTTTRWCTGVSVADVNADGWPDVYVSVANHRWSPSRGNLLFINQGLRNGSPVFREMAAEYGLADTLYCSQAAFFDYDHDGDLDCYLLHNFPENSTQNNLRPKRTDGSHRSTDRLLRNEGSDTRLKHPIFHDVSQTAGISIEGYGLGLAISDLNQDGWPDVYCANDFISNDLLWLNQKNGTFRNAIGSLLRHQSYNSMGVDVADYDNDARPDVLVLDMLPEGSPRQKIMLASQNFDKHALSTSQAYGYQPQFIRNVLQRNNGPGPDGQLSFSEVGQLAGVEKTDWSWSCLFADYDNDGFKDLSITNGYRKDVTDRDFLAFSDQYMLFGSAETEQQKRQELLAKIPEIKVSQATLETK
ncbi:MAG: VCBS repeat-containing protein [Bacteroidetes bacterium]|nr:VCBS repeat-containing protein [Fibrella sp.]